MKSSTSRNISRYETTAVYTHPEAEVDIVLVHGLNGGPEKTWTARDGTFWPTDLLPTALRGVHANILVYGYNADVYSRHNNTSASDNFIHEHAQTLVTSLTLYRRSEGTSHNPIIWVCHSLGGILVKRALLYSNDLRAAHHDDYRGIYVSTFGLMFLGTPHTGSDAATWGLVLQGMSDAVLPRKLFESESVLLKTLKKDNEALSNINSHFLDIYQRFRIHMAHENHKTDIKGTKILVVDRNSASPQLPGVTYYGVEATHSRMCKFDNSNAPGFRALSTDMRQWILEAPALIQRRWAVELSENEARARFEVQERMSPFTWNNGHTNSLGMLQPHLQGMTGDYARRGSDNMSISSISTLSSTAVSSAYSHSILSAAAQVSAATSPNLPATVLLLAADPIVVKQLAAAQATTNNQHHSVKTVPTVVESDSN